MSKVYKFFFETPLYAKISLTEGEDSLLSQMKQTKNIDGYNPHLKENTTYKIDSFINSGYLIDMPSMLEGYQDVKLECLRTGFTMRFTLLVEEDEGSDDDYIIQKVGQYPSRADLDIHKFKDYSKIISKERLKEITTGIGLNAHGVGIGSFVYLRRTFEFLIQEAKTIAQDQPDWDEKKYRESRMDIKIELLKDYLPDFLVQNKAIYSILSIGIHELEENECLKYFSTILLGIELILDEKLEHYNKQQKIKATQLKLQQIAKDIKGK